MENKFHSNDQQQCTHYGVSSKNCQRQPGMIFDGHHALHENIFTWLHSLPPAFNDIKHNDVCHVFW